MKAVPKVTVLVPARNEEADIARSLRALLAQDYPHNHMEVVVVDGGSTDRTAETASSVLSQGDVEWTVINHATGTTPSNLNAGLAVAQGEILCRVDARSVVPQEYVRLCAEVLHTRDDIIVTGGAQSAIPVDSSCRSMGIARALNNRYIMGGSRYRSGRGSGPTDTVYLGAFRTDQLRAVGGWDETMLTNQDYELNRRLSRQGIVWFDDRLRVDYVPRRTFGQLWRQYYRFGRWKARYWRWSGDAPQGRQWIRMFLALSGIGGALVFLGRRGNRQRRALTCAVLATGGLIAADFAGAAAPEVRRHRDHLTAVAGMCAAAGGWSVGVARELLGGRIDAHFRA